MRKYGRVNNLATFDVAREETVAKQCGLISFLPVTSGPGVYAIIGASRFYIGSTETLRTRKNNHFSVLRSGEHVNTHLQNSFSKNGESKFKFVCMEYCNVADLVEREQFWIDKMWGDGTILYNVLREAYSVRGVNHPMFGKRHTPEARLKIKEARSRQIVKHSPETRAKIGSSGKGRKHTQESKDKVSATKKSQAVTAWNKGLTAEDPRVAKHVTPKCVKASSRAAEILEWYASGDSVVCIKNRVGCSWRVVQRCLIENGIVPRTQSQQKRIRDWNKK